MLAEDDFGAERETVGPETAGSYVEAFEAIERDPNNQLLVAESGERVIAVLQLTFIPNLTYRGGWRAQVEGVRVAADLRGQGVGAALLQEAIARARAKGCVLVQLTTDMRRPDALRFYERLGFRATHHGMKLILRKQG